MHSKIENAHVILVSGGNTLYATDRWTALGLRDIFRTAMERGTVMTGGSAGAICWYHSPIYIYTSDFQHHTMFLCHQSSYCAFYLIPNHCVFVLDVVCCTTISSYRFDAGHSDSMDPDSYLRQQSCDGALCLVLFFFYACAP
jgi:peptidase E